MEIDFQKQGQKSLFPLKEMLLSNKLEGGLATSTLIPSVEQLKTIKTTATATTLPAGRTVFRGIQCSASPLSVQKP